MCGDHKVTCPAVPACPAFFNVSEIPCFFIFFNIFFYICPVLSCDQTVSLLMEY